MAMQLSASVEKHLANKLETFQMKFLRFSLNIHCGINNDNIRKSANVEKLINRISTLGKNWLAKSLLHNEDTKNFVANIRTIFRDTPLYILKC